MESQPQNPEFRNNPENSPMQGLISVGLIALRMTTAGKERLYSKTCLKRPLKNR